MARCGTSAVELLFLKKTSWPMRVIAHFSVLELASVKQKNTLSRPDSSFVLCFFRVDETADFEGRMQRNCVFCMCVFGSALYN